MLYRIFGAATWTAGVLYAAILITSAIAAGWWLVTGDPLFSNVGRSYLVPVFAVLLALIFISCFLRAFVRLPSEERDVPDHRGRLPG